MELKGIITKVYDMQSGTSDKGTWKRQEILVEHGDISNAKKVVFILRGEATIDRVHPVVGKKGTFKFDVLADEWNNRYYNKLYCYGFEELKEPASSAPISEQ